MAELHKMTTPMEPHIKVTIHEMYREQQETNKLLARVAVGLEGLQDLPERVRALEIQIATQKVDVDSLKRANQKANGAVIGAIMGFGTALYSLIIGK
jgi:DNA transposition AAA+ family ATPase